MISIEEVKEQAAEAERKAREAKAEYEFAKKYPQYNCRANFDILRRVHNGVEISVKSLEDLIQHPQVKTMLVTKDLQRILSDEEAQRQKEQHDTEVAKQKAQADEAKERVSLWNQIKSLLKVSPMMLEGERRKYELKDQKGNWIHPTEAMRTRLKTLQETSVFRGSSTEQLKQHLRGAKPKETGYVDKRGVSYPFLPKDVSASQIRVMWDAATLRNGIKKYGNEQITRRLQEYQEN